MTITEKDITKIAKLARIQVSEPEKQALVSQLGGIISFVAQLDEVDTQHTAIVASVVGQALPWREDKVTDGGQAAAIVQNAPISEYECFVVPKVIGES
ncbi:MAG: Asp-tRNA(Asn)/Glu-tRNA(Gln) amidotransferase subunit GatC [Rickettsiales bacterium]|nr:Asp-tRNA(Asn)/Glu-tRNA(Gln) amidotransferase subunit GatC [Rickettsiales bacterium]